jgi:hypothetical protein
MHSVEILMQDITKVNKLQKLINAARYKIIRTNGNGKAATFQQTSRSWG